MPGSDPRAVFGRGGGEDLQDDGGANSVEEFLLGDAAEVGLFFGPMQDFPELEERHACGVEGDGIAAGAVGVAHQAEGLVGQPVAHGGIVRHGGAKGLGVAEEVRKGLEVASAAGTHSREQSLDMVPHDLNDLAFRHL